MEKGNNDYKYMVCTRCFTYNHAPYIVEAMNGFTMQQTEFPFVCCIVDDASTDGEPEVIRNYLAENFQHPYRVEETVDYCLISANHNTNPNCSFVVFLLKYNHYSIKKTKMPYLSEWLDNAKYQAFCEGDDYWISHTKLQKQVDYLETHTDCVLVHTNFRALNNETKEIICRASHRYKVVDGYVFDDLINRCFVRTLTICYRHEVNFDNISLPDNTFSGDLFWFYILSKKGNFKFIDEETGVYRVLPHSATHFKTEEERFVAYEKYKRLDWFIADYYNLDENSRDIIDRKWFVLDLKHALRAKDFVFFKKIKMPKSGNSMFYRILFFLCQKEIFFYIVSFAIRKKHNNSIKNKWF